VRIVREIDSRVMFETSLLRVYYLNDLDDVDCKTCLFIPVQTRDNDKMLQVRVQCSIYNHKMYDCNDGAIRRWRIPCMIEMVHMTQCNYHAAMFTP
jgi:hypothetical protein